MKLYFYLICFTVLSFVESRAKTLYITQEVLDEHYTRLAKSNETNEVDSEPNESENDPPVNNTNNETKPEIKFTFWSGFVDSLSMIFFVSYGNNRYLNSS